MRRKRIVTLRLESTWDPEAEDEYGDVEWGGALTVEEGEDGEGGFGRDYSKIDWGMMSPAIDDAFEAVREFVRKVSAEYPDDGFLITEHRVPTPEEVGRVVAAIVPQ